MPTIKAKQIWSQTNLNNSVMVAWGNIISSRSDLVAAAGSVIYLFAPAANTEYTLISAADVGARVLSMAVGLAITPPQYIVTGLADRVVVFGIRDGTLTRVFETEPEPGALFIDLAIADIDGDGRDEVIAASEGRQTLYMYRLAEETPTEIRLELLALRILPGSAQKVTVLDRGAGNLPLIAAAFKNNSASGLLTLTFTERGFAEGPAEPNLPVSVTSLAAGELREPVAEEIAWGGGDGAVRIVGINDQLTNILTSDNLGNLVPALTAGMIAGGNQDTLIAGTPEGFLFGFTAPVAGPSPDWAVSTGSPVYDLALSSAGLLGLGTSDGAVQVWLLTPAGRTIHVVRPGETLYGLALRYRTTETAIAELNRIPVAGMIYPGQILIIP
ncbi:MAG: LysM peptidoglycan-binding domain-containing protein [Desulfotomaculaceae bacterium]|nr:LysM peptidoglycan-binding domain-containing protein [Desulfotomaculaceae bacterium]MDD4766627.1 LysM peptidoglycan-binding domain-containing protein [Desulfotomaculaceae bacterium]